MVRPLVRAQPYRSAAPASNATDKSVHDASMSDVVVEVQRVPTTPNAIALSQYSTPSFGTAVVGPVPAIAVVLPSWVPAVPCSVSLPLPSSVKLGTTLWLEADLRSTGEFKVLPSTPSNNYAMLARLIHNRAIKNNVSYSPGNMMPGMKKTIYVDAYSRDKMAGMLAKMQAAAAGGVLVSSSPSPPAV